MYNFYWGGSSYLITFFPFALLGFSYSFFYVSNCWFDGSLLNFCFFFCFWLRSSAQIHTHTRAYANTHTHTQTHTQSNWYGYSSTQLGHCVYTTRAPVNTHRIYSSIWQCSIVRFFVFCFALNGWPSFDSHLHAKTITIVRVDRHQKIKKKIYSLLRSPMCVTKFVFSYFTRLVTFRHWNTFSFLWRDERSSWMKPHRKWRRSIVSWPTILPIFSFKRMRVANGEWQMWNGYRNSTSVTEICDVDFCCLFVIRKLIFEPLMELLWMK